MSNPQRIALYLLFSACAVAQAAKPPRARPTATKPPATPTPVTKTMPKPPATRTVPAHDTLFGVDVTDPYRWLEDVKSDEVKTWMAAQDGYARTALTALPGRDALATRLRALLYVDSLAAPQRRGSRYFYSRTHADREKAIQYWREGTDGEEHVLLDPNKMSDDGSISIGFIRPSWDGKTAVYAVKANNSDESTLHVMDVATGKVSDIDVIPGTKYGLPSWTPTGDGFYYVRLPTDPSIPIADRPGYAEVRFHRLGTDPTMDPLIHERTGDPRTFISVDLSRDGHFLFAEVQHGWVSTDVYYRDMRKTSHDRHGASQGWRPLITGVKALFTIEAWKDRFYIHTNDGAPRWRVLVADPDRPARDAWRELVPEKPDAVIQTLQLRGGHLVLNLLKDASSRIEVRTLEGKPVRDVELPGIGTTSGMTGNPEDDDAYYSFASFTQPTQIYRTSIKSGATSLYASIKVPIDPSAYTVEQVFYPSKDGTRIPMFLIHRKDLAKNGGTPFVLYGYGGFNNSLTPGFNPIIYPWLEAGGGYAIANLRGGGEYGEAWHEAGMLAKKQNVFDDFIGAGEYLVKEGYTRPERLAIRGGSNGGLLVGAAMTQRPDLYRAVICAVPLLDMVRYHLFGSGKTWIGEYGSAEDQAGFKTLYAYSPYHHVQKGTAYPALLMMSADSDDRVDPMHARKMTAALQATSTSSHPILLRIERHAGHGGADLVKQLVDQNADMWAFLMKELGLRPAQVASSSPHHRPFIPHTSHRLCNEPRVAQRLDRASDVD